MPRLQKAGTRNPTHPCIVSSPLPPATRTRTGNPPPLSSDEHAPTTTSRPPLPPLYRQLASPSNMINSSPFILSHHNPSSSCDVRVLSRLYAMWCRNMCVCAEGVLKGIECRGWKEHASKRQCLRGVVFSSLPRSAAGIWGLAVF